MKDMSTDLYIVDAGILKAMLSDDEGDEIVLAHFEKGAFFGELSLLDGKGRSATIVADSDSELSVLSQADFLGLLNKDPKIAVALMTTLVERLRKADEKIESLAFQEVSERLIRALLDGAKPDDSGGKGYLKRGKLTHKELSGMIGSSREAVSKCMKMLSTIGIVKESDGQPPHRRERPGAAQAPLLAITRLQKSLLFQNALHPVNPGASAILAGRRVRSD